VNFPLPLAARSFRSPLKPAAQLDGPRKRLISGAQAAWPLASVVAEQMTCPDTLNVTVSPVRASRSDVLVNVAEKYDRRIPVGAATRYRRSDWAVCVAAVFDAQHDDLARLVTDAVEDPVRAAACREDPGQLAA
jgi:hypothetical protein